MELNIVYNEDCLQGMDKIDNKSIDMILCDLPYGITNNKWDTVIPFEPLWKQYNRIIKDNGAMVFTGHGLFSANLIKSNEKYYRYSLVWEKTMPVGFLNAHRKPLQIHEDIIVFYKKLPKYNPQFVVGDPYTKKRVKDGNSDNYSEFKRAENVSVNNGYRFPTSIIKIANSNYKNCHTTQKPVALFEYLIKTYTDEGDIVLDSCIGSGTTAVACINTNRNFVGFEIDKKYYDIAIKRIDEAMSKKKESEHGKQWF